MVDEEQAVAVKDVEGGLPVILWTDEFVFVGDSVRDVRQVLLVQKEVKGQGRTDC